MKMEREHEHETKSAHKQHKVCTNKIARQHERALGRALVTNHSKSTRGSEQEGVRENACKRETMERLLKIIGLFCKRTLCKRRYSARETYNFKESTNGRELDKARARVRERA